MRRVRRDLRYSLPQSPGEKVSVSYNVCWKCGLGPEEHLTLYNNGQSESGQTVYACAAHRGLTPQATKIYG